MNAVRAPRGQSLVEFALTLPILLLVIFLFIDLGRAIYFYSAVSNAVREGARYATVTPFTDSAQRKDLIGQVVLEKAVAVPLNSADITIYCDLDATAFITTPCNTHITVAAVVEFQPVTIFLAEIIGGTNTISLTATSTMQMTPFGKQ
jgi:Flp pilus assembly protein TadG